MVGIAIDSYGLVLGCWLTLAFHLPLLQLVSLTAKRSGLGAQVSLSTMWYEMRYKFLHSSGFPFYQLGKSPHFFKQMIQGSALADEFHVCFAVARKNCAKGAHSFPALV